MNLIFQQVLDMPVFTDQPLPGAVLAPVESPKAIIAEPDKKPIVTPTEK